MAIIINTRILSKKKIFIIRHGETEFNKKGIVQGSGVNSSLNQTGIAQADAFFKAYSHVRFDKVYTSKLKRTHQSVKGFIESGYPWQELEGLNEISWGYKEGRALSNSDNEQYITMLDAWNSGDYTQKVPGGESPLKVQQRQAIAWKYLMANEHEKNVLVCMHGRAMRILFCLLTGTELKHMDSFAHKNLCLYIVSAEPEGFTIETTCDTRHLKVLQTAKC